MPFIYYGQGVSSFFKDFVERLMSELALRGTEITNKSVGLERAEMDVKYIDEKGTLFFTIEGENVKVTYDVEREREEVKRGLRGAIAGAGLGSLMRGVLGGGGDLKDRVVDAASGALAGGSYEAYEGYEDSKEARTAFAQELAEAAKVVEDDLQYIANGQEAAREALREQAREAREEERMMMDELEEVFADAISLKEEIELAELEGSDVKRSKIRVERAEILYKEAREAIKIKDYTMARAKMKAARNMIEKATEFLDF
ncbi:hypothetical protein ACFL0D_03125 [Thermoproteota archaeon]